MKVTKIISSKFNTVGALRNVIPTDKVNKSRITKNNEQTDLCPDSKYIGDKVWNVGLMRYETVPYFDCDYIE